MGIEDEYELSPMGKQFKKDGTLFPQVRVSVNNLKKQEVALSKMASAYIEREKPKIEALKDVLERVPYEMNPFYQRISPEEKRLQKEIEKSTGMPYESFRHAIVCSNDQEYEAWEKKNQLAKEYFKNALCLANMPIKELRRHPETDWQFACLELWLASRYHPDHPEKHLADLTEILGFEPADPQRPFEGLDMSQRKDIILKELDLGLVLNKTRIWNIGRTYDQSWRGDGLRRLEKAYKVNSGLEVITVASVLSLPNNAAFVGGNPERRAGNLYGELLELVMKEGLPYVVTEAADSIEHQQTAIKDNKKPLYITDEEAAEMLFPSHVIESVNWLIDNPKSTKAEIAEGTKQKLNTVETALTTLRGSDFRLNYQQKKMTKERYEYWIVPR